jgi:hypothetical protein
VPAAAEKFFTSRLPEPAATWFREALRVVRAEGEGHQRFLGSWSSAGRRLGPAPVTLSPEDEAALALHANGWGTDELGRALLLLASLEAKPRDADVATVEDLFMTGDLRERQAVMRALPTLPAPERFVAVAVEAVRHNATSVIEAIACENPYPSAYFPEEAFNQLALKCLFCGLSLRRVQDLPRRSTDELRRMVAGYVSERVAAGRSVPEDVAVVLEGAPHAPV